MLLKYSGLTKGRNMVENIEGLAKAMGLPVKDLIACQQEIAHTVESYTDGVVSVTLNSLRIHLRNTLGVQVEAKLVFPFSEDTFWKEVEWVEDEANNSDEEDEDVYSGISLTNTIPHEFYD